MGAARRGSEEEEEQRGETRRRRKGGKRGGRRGSREEEEGGSEEGQEEGCREVRPLLTTAPFHCWDVRALQEVCVLVGALVVIPAGGWGLLRC